VAELFTTENAIAFLTLASLEIVLGIDNIVFISILTGKLPPKQQPGARRLGLLLAMGLRIVLLLGIRWVMGLTAVLFTVLEHDVSGKDLILIVGGLFLLAKATFEIHDKLEGEEHERDTGKVVSYGAVLAQIALLDMVFSLDSVITAVGMVKRVEVMIAAVVVAILVMMIFAGRIASFIERRPTMKMLALSFLLLIGFVLVLDGVGKHIEKGYIYFAMGFSLFVELLNMRRRAKKKAAPVKLRHTKIREVAGATAE